VYDGFDRADAAADPTADVLDEENETAFVGFSDGFGTAVAALATASAPALSTSKKFEALARFAVTATSPKTVGCQPSYFCFTLDVRGGRECRLLFGEPSTGEKGAITVVGVSPVSQDFNKLVAGDRIIAIDGKGAWCCRWSRTTQPA
jgi:hypothetical protein